MSRDELRRPDSDPAYETGGILKSRCLSAIRYLQATQLPNA